MIRFHLPVSEHIKIFTYMYVWIYVHLRIAFPEDWIVWWMCWFSCSIVVLLYKKRNEIMIDSFFKLCPELCHFNIYYVLLLCQSCKSTDVFVWFFFNSVPFFSFMIAEVYILFVLWVIMMIFFLLVFKHANIYISVYVYVCMFMYVLHLLETELLDGFVVCCI